MKILIAIPCMDSVSTPFVQSLLAIKNVDQTAYMMSAGSLVYDSRNRLAEYAVKNEFDYLFFLDSDMVFEPDLLEQMVESIGDKDFLSALCFSRKPPTYRPCVYSRMGYDVKEKNVEIFDEVFWDYPKNAIFEVEGAGMACALIKVSMLQAVKEQKGLPFSPIIGFGEDLSFCIKARQCGFHLYCDSSIKVGHIGNVIITEEVYEVNHGSFINSENSAEN